MELSLGHPLPRMVLNSLALVQSFLQLVVTRGGFNSHRAGTLAHHDKLKRIAS